MTPSELRNLLEGRIECVTGESTYERIRSLQRDLDILENDCAEGIKALLNQLGLEVRSVAFNIEILYEPQSPPSDVRYVNVKRKLRPIE
jgi:hypothetical protein